MYADIKPDPTRANVFANGNLMCTIHPDNPLVPWLKIAADWQTLTPTAQATLRPIITRAVRHLFKLVADDYEPSPVWYMEDVHEGGIESLARIGGTWNRNTLTAHVLILHAIGLSDDEIAELLAPIHEKTLEMAYGGGVDDLDDAPRPGNDRDTRAVGV